MLYTLAREKVALRELVSGLHATGEQLRSVYGTTLTKWPPSRLTPSPPQDLRESSEAVTSLNEDLAEAKRCVSPDSVGIARLDQMSGALQETRRGIASALRVQRVPV